MNGLVEIIADAIRSVMWKESYNGTDQMQNEEIDKAAFAVAAAIGNLMLNPNAIPRS